MDMSWRGWHWRWCTETCCGACRPASHCPHLLGSPTGTLPETLWTGSWCGTLHQPEFPPNIWSCTPAFPSCSPAQKGTWVSFLFLRGTGLPQKKKKKRPCEGELNVLTHPISWIRIGFFIFGHSPPRPLVFVVLLPQHVAFGDVSEHMVMLWKLLGMIGSQLKSLKSKPDEWFPEGFQNIWPCCTKGLIYSQVTGHT